MIFSKIGLVKEFLCNSENRPGFRMVWQTVKKILKHIFPKKIDANVEFGTGDPCTTGQALGAIMAICPRIIKTTRIVPNFEAAMIEGDLYAKGRIRIGTVGMVIIKLIINHDFKYVLKDLNRLKEEL